MVCLATTCKTHPHAAFVLNMEAKATSLRSKNRRVIAASQRRTGTDTAMACRLGDDQMVITSYAHSHHKPTEEGGEWTNDGAEFGATVIHARAGFNVGDGIATGSLNKGSLKAFVQAHNPGLVVGATIEERNKGYAAMSVAFDKQTATAFDAAVIGRLVAYGVPMSAGLKRNQTVSGRDFVKLLLADGDEDTPQLSAAECGNGMEQDDLQGEGIFTTWSDLPDLLEVEFTPSRKVCKALDLGSKATKVTIEEYLDAVTELAEWVTERTGSDEDEAVDLISAGGSDVYPIDE